MKLRASCRALGIPNRFFASLFVLLCAVTGMLLPSGGVWAKEEVRQEYWRWGLYNAPQWGEFESPEAVREAWNLDQEQRYAQCAAGTCNTCNKIIISSMTQPVLQNTTKINGKFTWLTNAEATGTSFHTECNGRPSQGPTTITNSGGTRIAYARRYCPPGFSPRNSPAVYEEINGVQVPTYNAECFKEIPDPPQCCKIKEADPRIGNPIDVMGESKVSNDMDYASGDGLLRVGRSYSSALGRWNWGHETTLVDFTGRGTTPTTRADLIANIKIIPPGIRDVSIPAVDTQASFPLIKSFNAGPTAWFIAADGRRTVFTETSTNVFSTPSLDRPQLSVVSSGSTYHWRAKSPAGTLLTFSAAGDLIQEAFADGKSLQYVRGAGTLTVTAMPGGRQLVYSRSSDDVMAGKYDVITLPDGSELRYAFNDKGLVTSVTYADRRNKTYLYDEPAYAPAPSSGGSWARLTGLLDEDNARFGTYTYNSTSPIATELAGGVNQFAITYFSGRAEFTRPPLNAEETIRWATGPDGERRVISRQQPAGAGSAAATTTLTYDAGGYIASVVNYKGNRTCYLNDQARGLETVRLEGLATGVACPANLASHNIPANTRQRKISTQWHSVWNFPVARAEPKKLTKWIYNGQVDPATSATANCAPTAAVLPDGSPIAVVCKRIEQETTDATGTLGLSAVLTGTPRIWTYTYNDYGQVLSVDGPRTDVSDVVTYTYHTCDTGHECGQVATITNAAGHTTTYSTYNAHGQPLTIVDPNGVTTTLAYDLRQRLTSRTVGYEQTTFSYRATGLLERVTLPDASYLQYSYDPAHRLTAISDSSGNRIEYTLDDAGNRTAENVYDPTNTLSRARSRVFDALSRASQEIGAAGTAAVTTAIAYDANGNQATINAPLGRNTAQQYDELNRLKQVTDPLTGVTVYGYNALDQLISVTDPRSKVTSYTYDAFGGLLQQVSPDTGTTVNTYDAAGNLLTSTDARSLTATYSHDALNRVTSISYPDQTISYTYDTGSNQNGRLTQVTDNSGSTSWSYDPQGRVLSKQQSMGITKSVGYAYDLSGRLQTLTLPSGNTITYGYTDGKVTSLTLNGSTSLLSDVLYEPFGPTRGWTWGNGMFSVREYNEDGLITGVDSAGLKIYGYDDAFRITDITDADNASLSQSYGYDLLDRLTSATGPSLNQGWTYDANGNRLTQTGSAASAFTISSTSNRLSSVTGALTRAYSYDDAGNTTSDGTTTFVYNNAGRMISATKSGTTTTYAHNALGQRVRKTQSGSSRYFVYDESGHLLGEYDNTGALIQETVWFADTPVATLRPNGAGVDVFYVHSDHLNAPRKITRPSDNGVVWRWDGDPFGTTAAKEDPDGNAVAVSYGLRFPGQYFDAETGLSYNYYRDGYDPLTGRYTQSDPVGLSGDLNTYTYVLANPISFIDPFGLTALEFDVASGRLRVDPEVPGRKPYEIDATSGRGKCENNPECERRKNEGPIPRGSYYIDPNQIDNPPLLDDLRRNFRTPRSQGGGDWGDWRVRIYPNPGTQRFGRTGFYLHGGYFDGSAGCIDIGGGIFGDDRLLEDLLRDPDGRIPLRVR